MPTYRNPFVKGDLIIKFNINFPEDGFASEDQLTVRVLYSLTLKVLIRARTLMQKLNNGSIFLSLIVVIKRPSFRSYK